MYDTYVTQNGDTIDKISKKYNTSPEVLYQLNGYEFSITPGMTLIVPRITSKYFDYYKVNKGDTLYKIATENKLEPNLLAQLNGLNLNDYIYPNQTLLIPKSGSILYFTAVGDTLSEVANGFKASVSDLVSQNDKIYLQPEQLIIYKYK